MKIEIEDIPVVAKESDLDTLPEGLYRLSGEQNMRSYDIRLGEFYDGPHVRIARVMKKSPFVPQGVDLTVRSDGALIAIQWVGTGRALFHCGEVATAS